jgi:hypothetical protein
MIKDCPQCDGAPLRKEKPEKGLWAIDAHGMFVCVPCNGTGSKDKEEGSEMTGSSTATRACKAGAGVCKRGGAAQAAGVARGAARQVGAPRETQRYVYAIVDRFGRVWDEPFRNRDDARARKRAVNAGDDGRDFGPYRIVRFEKRDVVR